jgi:hypothetical protein
MKNIVCLRALLLSSVVNAFGYEETTKQIMEDQGLLQAAYKI